MERRPASVIVILLLLTLGLTGVMAWQAQSAARHHREAAEGALRDYARFAAFLYRQAGRVALMRTGGGVVFGFESIHPAGPDAPLPSLAQALARPPAEACPMCPRIDSLRGYFRLDLRDGSAERTGTALPEPARAWLADTARKLTRSPSRPEGGLEAYILLTRAGGTDRALTYIVRREPGGAPVAAYGFDADPRTLARAAFKPVFAGQGVLPPSLTRGLAPDSLLSLVVLDPAGRELFASPRRYAGGVEATDTVGALVGGMRVRVSLRRAEASRLLIGGLPKSRLPFLIALLALAAGLTAVALAQLRRERELVRVRADFVSSVSHELRTPLSQIRMFAETLRLGRVRSDAERQRSIEIIDQEARRLSGLVENVLLFSRAERRAVRLDRRSEALDALARDAVETFAPLAAARRVMLRERLQPGIRAEVDRGAFRQMLLNLLDNAVKYGPAGQTVEIGLVAEGGTARVWVQDEGPGIPPKERERIFRPFARLRRDAESAVAGSGIGLAVVAQLAALHDGRVRVDEAPGGGARFTLELPARTDAGEPERAMEPAQGVA
ncbi:MAG: sensor histidine kinase [Longimicrobiaceae bacterium]